MTNANTQHDALQHDRQSRPRSLTLPAGRWVAPTSRPPRVAWWFLAIGLSALLVVIMMVVVNALTPSAPAATVLSLLASPLGSMIMVLVVIAWVLGFVGFLDVLLAWDERR